MKKVMSERTFFARFKARHLSGKGFRVCRDSAIREAATGCCPVTAVCADAAGAGHKVSEFLAAADAMGLPRELAGRIACAADDECPFDPEVRRLRAKLLRVLDAGKRKRK